MEIKAKITDEIFKPLTDEQLESLSRKDLITIAKTEQMLRRFLEAYSTEMEEKLVQIQGNYYRIKAQLFSPGSEKSPKEKPEKQRDSQGKNADKPKACAPKSLTERYPEAPVIEKNIAAEKLPTCPCCGETMEDSGLTEDSEYLTGIPKQYIVIRQHRRKYRCRSCHGAIVTSPNLPRVVPGSSYSDELIIDATLSKYCDLIPMERYCEMAGRGVLSGLPPQSMIGGSFKLGEFMVPAYEKTRAEALGGGILNADETPHKMLEGDEKKGWFLWIFLGEKSCFFECHDTRSGDVASAVLKESNCEVLVSDVYSGYKKAVRETNEYRAANGKPPIAMAYCNSHARRGFKANEFEAPNEASFMLQQYKAIYHLNSLSKDKPLETVQELRSQMKPYFEAMKLSAEKWIDGFSSKSGISKALNYFLKNYEGLTYCLEHPRVPLDNNAAERAIRSPVVGRKTWYGTHSRAGALAAARHFRLVESCKMNGINPRAYYLDVVRRIHLERPVLTPREFAQSERGPPDEGSKNPPFS